MRLAPVAITAAIILSFLPRVQADEWTNVVTNYATDHDTPGHQYGLRDVTLSPDQNWVYGSWVHGDSIRWLYRYDAHQTVLDTQSTPNYAGSLTLNHLASPMGPAAPGDDNNTNWQSVVQVGNYIYGGTDVTNATAMSTPGGADGYYGGFQGIVVAPWNFAANSTSVLDEISTTPLGGGVGGVASSGNYLYATIKNGSDGIIARYDISNPTTPTAAGSWSFQSLGIDLGTDNLTTANNFHGLVAMAGADNSTDLYIASGNEGTTARGAGTLYHVNIDSGGNMTLVSSVTTQYRLQDVAYYKDALYATEWAGASSQIAKIGITSTGGLQDEGYIDGPAHPFDGGDQYRNSSGGGYSGIDITSAGNIWIGNQYWNDSGAAGAPDELLTDQMDESAPIPEPGTIALFGLGVPVLIGTLRRKRRAA